MFATIARLAKRVVPPGALSTSSSAPSSPSSPSSASTSLTPVSSTGGLMDHHRNHDSDGNDSILHRGQEAIDDHDHHDDDHGRHSKNNNNKALVANSENPATTITSTTNVSDVKQQELAAYRMHSHDKDDHRPHDDSKESKRALVAHAAAADTAQTVPSIESIGSVYNDSTSKGLSLALSEKTDELQLLPSPPPTQQDNAPYCSTVMREEEDNDNDDLSAPQPQSTMSTTNHHDAPPVSIAERISMLPLLASSSSQDDCNLRQPAQDFDYAAMTMTTTRATTTTTTVSTVSESLAKDSDAAIDKRSPPPPSLSSRTRDDHTTLSNAFLAVPVTATATSKHDTTTTIVDNNDSYDSLSISNGAAPLPLSDAKNHDESAAFGNAATVTAAAAAAAMDRSLVYEDDEKQPVVPSAAASSTTTTTMTATTHSSAATPAGTISTPPVLQKSERAVEEAANLSARAASVHGSDVWMTTQIDKGPTRPGATQTDVMNRTIATNAVVTPMLDRPQDNASPSITRTKTHGCSVARVQESLETKQSQSHYEYERQSQNVVSTTKPRLQKDSTREEQNAGESSMEQPAQQQTKPLIVRANVAVETMDAEASDCSLPVERQEVVACNQYIDVKTFMSPQDDSTRIYEAEKTQSAIVRGQFQRASTNTIYSNPLELFAELAVAQPMQEVTDWSGSDRESSIPFESNGEAAQAKEGTDNDDNADSHDESGSQLMSLLLAAESDNVHGNRHHSADEMRSLAEGDASEDGFFDVRRSKRPRSVPSKFSRDDIIADIKSSYSKRHCDERVVDMSMMCEEHDSHSTDDVSSSTSSDDASDNDSSLAQSGYDTAGTRKLQSSVWTADEDTMVVDQRERCGLSFDEISDLMPGRTPDACKSRFNRLIRLKRLKRNKAVVPNERPYGQPHGRRKRRKTRHVSVRRGQSFVADERRSHRPEWTDDELSILLDRRDRCGLSFDEISELMPGRSSSACKSQYGRLLLSNNKAVGRKGNKRSAPIPREPVDVAETRSKRQRSSPALLLHDVSVASRTRKQDQFDWTEEEDTLLFDKRDVHGFSFDDISLLLPGRTVGACKGRYYKFARSKKKVRRPKLTQEKATAAPSDNESTRSEIPNKEQQEWSKTEDSFLREKRDRCGLSWSEIANLMEGRSPSACSTRYYCRLSTPKVKKQTRLPGAENVRVKKNFADTGNDFSPEEDAILRRKKASHVSYDNIAKSLPGRSAKECRERFERLSHTAKTAHHRTALGPHGFRANRGLANKGHDFSPEEDAILRRKKASHLSYANIAKTLPGRSAKECRERFEILSRTTKTVDAAPGHHGLKATHCKNGNELAPKSESAIENQPARSLN